MSASISSHSSTSAGSSSTIMTLWWLPRGSSRPATTVGLAASPATGSQTSNLVPSPGFVVTSIAPPRSVTMPCTRDSPRPVPLPTPLVVKNGSNMRSSTAGRMPVPVSLTMSRTCGPGETVPRDRSEDIVEVMGDAAGQRPHRLHLLRLPQLRLQAFLVEFRLFLRAYVDCGADKPIRLAGRVAQTPATREQPMPRAVRLTYAVLALVLRRTPLEMIRYGGLEARHVVGVNDDVRPPRGASWDCGV